MTRGEFFTLIAGSATAVKAIGQTEPDGSAPKQTRLLVLEIPDILSDEQHHGIRQYLEPYHEKYGIEFLILEGGARVVDPSLPPSQS